MPFLDFFLTASSLDQEASDIACYIPVFTSFFVDAALLLFFHFAGFLLIFLCRVILPKNV